MSYEAKTQNLNLPQWVSGDKPEMLDFNKAFQAIDTGVGAKQNKIAASGILKGNGAGGVSAAVAGTDYATPAQAAWPKVVEISPSGTYAEYFEPAHAIVFKEYAEDDPMNCLFFTPQFSSSAPLSGASLTFENVKFVFTNTYSQSPRYPVYTGGSTWVMRGWLSIAKSTNTITVSSTDGSGVEKFIPSYPVWCSYTGEL